MRTEIMNRMMAKAAGLRDYLGESSGLVTARLSQALHEKARFYSIALGDEDPDVAERAARSLMAGMYGSDTPPVEFWLTETGRAVSLAIGYPSSPVPQAVAAVILGVSRQRVFRLLEEGKLARVGEGVTPTSLRDRLRARAAR